MWKSYSTLGLTFFEVMLLSVIIFILGVLVLPNFRSSGRCGHIPSVKANMHTSQLATESYGTDAKGGYPSTPEGLGPYMPGGGNEIGTSSGHFPTNPTTDVVNELPALCLLNTREKVLAARKRRDASNIGGGKVGQTTYVGIPDLAHPKINTSYAITGVDKDGNDVVGNLGKMVLSNE